MLFNSAIFIYGFVPVFYVVYFLMHRRGMHAASLVWVLVSSLFFYSWWNPKYLPLLLISIFMNYLFYNIIVKNERYKKNIFIIGILFNVSLIAYFKYAGFISENIGSVFGVDFHVQVSLPLAISFFTFQQIAFLADAYHGRISQLRPLEYAVFISFFPQLIAGPIVHHSEMMPQFARKERSVTPLMQAVAISLFTFGLFKKTIIADSIAPIANTVFSKADALEPLSAAEALLGALAYTLQLYYDFSGYSEMALGLALFIGIRLPVNFLSPYKSGSIIEFWRRWHMTLSRFLRDYIYIPLGGNRRGRFRRYLNLLATMLIGGIWHGAGWTFIWWGGYHGVLLVLNHAWNRLKDLLGLPSLPRPLAVCFTFFLVMLGWIVFRAETTQGALHMLQAILWPERWMPDYQDLHAILKAGGDKLAVVLTLMIGSLVAIFALPSVINWHLGIEGAARFRAGPFMLAVNILMWAIIIYRAGGTHEFLYFQF